MLQWYLVTSKKPWTAKQNFQQDIFIQEVGKIIQDVEWS